MSPAVCAKQGRHPRTPRASAQYHEKHRAPARVPRAGVDGGSAPDAANTANNVIMIYTPTAQGAVGGQGL